MQTFLPRLEISKNKPEVCNSMAKLFINSTGAILACRNQEITRTILEVDYLGDFLNLCKILKKKKNIF